MNMRLFSSITGALLFTAPFCLAHCAETKKTNPLEMWSPTGYAEHSSVQQSNFERFFDYNSLFGCTRVLDIGCGDGRLTAKIAEYLKQGQVIGIDSSESMVQYASSLFPKEKHKNLLFEKALAQNFHFDVPFDYILSIYTLHWVKEQEETLKNIYNHLTPDGKVFFILAPSKEGLPFDRALKQTMEKWNFFFKDFKSNQNFYDVETYRRMLVGAGFHVDAIHYLFTESLHDNKEELGQWVRQWLPHYKALPQQSREEFMKQLMDNYVTQIKQSPQQAPLLWGEYILVIKASKQKWTKL